MTEIGTIHVAIPSGMTAAEVDALYDRVTDAAFWDGALDVGVSMHLDGPCEKSAHCFRAFLRRVQIIVPPRRSSLRSRW